VVSLRAALYDMPGMSENAAPGPIRLLVSQTGWIAKSVRFPNSRRSSCTWLGSRVALKVLSFSADVL